MEWGMDGPQLFARKNINIAPNKIYTNRMKKKQHENDLITTHCYRNSIFYDNR